MALACVGGRCHGEQSVSVFLAIAAVTAGFPLLVLAAQRRLRRPAAGLILMQDWRGLRERYARTDKSALMVSLLLAGLATLGFTSLLFWLGSSYQAALPAGVYQRMPRLTWVEFLLPSLVLGILTAVLATDVFLRWTLGDRYGEYELSFGGGGPGRRGDRGMPLVTCIVAGLVTAFVILSVDCYSHFEEERIVLNPFWGIGEQSYPYSAVEAVVRASHSRAKGRERPHTRYFILFADGRRWCNEDYGPPTPDVLEEDAALVDFVCRKSGKTLTCVRHIEEVFGR